MNDNLKIKYDCGCRYEYQYLATLDVVKNILSEEVKVVAFRMCKLHKKVIGVKR